MAFGLTACKTAAAGPNCGMTTDGLAIRFVYPGF